MTFLERKAPGRKVTIVLRFSPGIGNSLVRQAEYRTTIALKK